MRLFDWNERTSGLYLPRLLAYSHPYPCPGCCDPGNCHSCTEGQTPDAFEVDMSGIVRGPGWCPGNDCENLNDVFILEKESVFACQGRAIPPRSGIRPNCCFGHEFENPSCVGNSPYVGLELHVSPTYIDDVLHTVFALHLLQQFDVRLLTGAVWGLFKPVPVNCSQIDGEAMQWADESFAPIKCRTINSQVLLSAA